MFSCGITPFGLYDREACPTQYPKAACTLMSMHNPSMQEALSQFMCHERSTVERHCRHHMSHKYLSTVFTEIVKCQTLSDVPRTSLEVIPKSPNIHSPDADLCEEFSNEVYRPSTGDSYSISL